MRSLTNIASLTLDDIHAILDIPLRGQHVLNGGSVALMFHEHSTRTRFSFTQATLRVGLTPVDLNPSLSSEQKGETTIDTCRNLAWAGARAIVIRTSKNGLPADVASAVDVPIINAGDGTNEHPSQALGDALTLFQHFGQVKGLTVAIVGDVYNSRVARSNAHLLSKLGADVRLVYPRARDVVPQDVPRSGDFDYPEEGLVGADVVMVLRWQHERHGVNSLHPDLYRIDEALIARLAPAAMVMHPGPVNRGVEVTSDVVDGPRSLVKHQVVNGVKARTKLLLHLLSR